MAFATGMYNILVVGAGYLGSRIAEDFKTKKQRVYALTRNTAKAARFESKEIIPVLADLTRPETLLKIPPAHFIVLCAAPDEGTDENYQAIYKEGTKNLLNAVRKNPNPYLVLYISSTSVWEDQADGWVDEEKNADSRSYKSQMLLAGEDLVLDSGFPAVILRLSGIYGPERNRIQALRDGRWPEKEMRDGYMNMIHVDDIVKLIPVLFKKGKEGNVYTGTDDSPVLRSEFVRWLSEKTGVPVNVKWKNEKPAGKRLSNQKLKDLEIEFQYPSFREGYETILKQEEH